MRIWTHHKLGCGLTAHPAAGTPLMLTAREDEAHLAWLEHREDVLEKASTMG